MADIFRPDEISLRGVQLPNVPERDATESEMPPTPKQREGRQALSQKDMRSLWDRAEPIAAAERPAVAPKGWGQTLKEGFATGVERAGAGLSAFAGRSPDVVAADLADTHQYEQSAEERGFDEETARRAQAFDDAEGFKDSAAAALDILGLMASNPKQAAKKVAESLGTSSPAYAAAIAGADGREARGRHG
jgi:hypothetical protein